MIEIIFTNTVLYNLLRVREIIVLEAVVLGGNCLGAIARRATVIGRNCPGSIDREVIILGEVRIKTTSKETIFLPVDDIYNLAKKQ